MPFSCLTINKNTINTIFLLIATAAISDIAAIFPSYAEIFEKKCSLVDPRVEQENDMMVFSIKLSCGAEVSGEVPIAIGKDFLLGLTVYALQKEMSANNDTADSDANVEKALRKQGADRSKFSINGVDYVVRQKPLPASEPTRRVISDEIYSSTVHVAKPFDFAVQLAHLEKDTTTAEFKFTVNRKTIAEHNYFLFALWPASQKKPCDEKDEDRRSGCGSYGYVIGDDGGAEPVDFYPGRTTVRDGNRDGVSRWVVEGFR